MEPSCIASVLLHPWSDISKSSLASASVIPSDGEEENVQLTDKHHYNRAKGPQKCNLSNASSSNIRGSSHLARGRTVQICGPGNLSGGRAVKVGGPSYNSYTLHPSTQ